MLAFKTFGEQPLEATVVRRYLERNLAKLKYCYERELLAKPDLVAGPVQFMKGVVLSIGLPKPTKPMTAAVTLDLSIEDIGGGFVDEPSCRKVPAKARELVAQLGDRREVQEARREGQRAVDQAVRKGHKLD